jgi:hypothetical protein
MKPGHSGGFAGGLPFSAKYRFLKANPIFVVGMTAAQRSALSRGF